ncbi:hypothetical protein MG293_002749 [Ovis ammon polii]|uniref:Uncharacterized protein n=1 Tax=Ovis ammon polii TaxID=230172 RepID=A0AAD4UK64_OVIAM|nr:hypothetical protein MG293_002749 [Ovis ammon polii]
MNEVVMSDFAYLQLQIWNGPLEEVLVDRVHPSPGGRRQGSTLGRGLIPTRGSQFSSRLAASWNLSSTSGGSPLLPRASSGRRTGRRAEATGAGPEKAADVAFSSHAAMGPVEDLKGPVNLLPVTPKQIHLSAVSL